MSRKGRNVGRSNEETLKAISGMSPGVSDAFSHVDELRDQGDAAPALEAARPVPENLRSLVLLGRAEEDVILGAYTIKLSTLSNGEQKGLVKSIMKLDPEDRVVSIKEETLSLAIRSINGLTLEELYGANNSGLSNKEMRADILSSLQSNLIDSLYKRYEKLVTETNGMFDDDGKGSDEVKN